mgnify:CR=1 FL=1
MKTPKEKAMNIDQLKHSTKDKLKFHLRDALIYSSDSGYTYSKFLDIPQENPPTDESYAKLTKQKLEKQREYIESNLENNRERFENQINIQQMQEIMAPTRSCTNNLYLN